MKKVLMHALAVTVLFAAVWFLFLYSVKNISPVTQTLPEKDSDTDIQQTTRPQPVPEQEKKVDLSDVVEALSDAAQSAQTEGFVVSENVYNFENFRLVLCDTAKYGFPDEAKYSFEIMSDDGTAACYSDFTVRPHMGFIFVNDGTKNDILSSNGKALAISEQYSLSPVLARDASGSPVFVDRNTWSYVTLLPDGTVMPTDYDAERDFRGVFADYPSYYGVSDDPGYEISQRGRGYGFKINGENKVNASYQKAFNYSEGFGCAYDAQNRLYFFNHEGRLRIAGLAEVMYGAGERTDETALGYYYFDEGLTRVTKRTYSRGKLVSERETFVDRTGDEFKTPADYSVYSYSDGMILLKKDGFGGYMNSRGKWILQPEYTYTRPFFEGLAAVGYENGKKGMIDKNGNFVIPPVFDEITDCSGGVICAYEKTGGWYIINKTERPIPQESEQEEQADEQPENAEN